MLKAYFHIFHRKISVKLDTRCKLIRYRVILLAVQQTETKNPRTHQQCYLN